MVSNTDAGLKDLASQLFVKKYFPADAKKRMDELVNNLQAGFKNRHRKVGLDGRFNTSKSIY